MTHFGKIEFSPNRHDWRPTPLPEQIVLITTIDSEERPHLATKSRISIISYGPPTILVFACRADYTTASNLQTANQFVVNVPGDDLVATSWIVGSAPSSRGPELFEENGLTPIPSLKVRVPRIAECRAHLECEIEETKRIGQDLAVFGKVVSVSVNKSIIEKDEALSYHRLAPFFFLDSNRTASLGASRRVEEPVPGPRHDLTILATKDLKNTVEFYSQAFDWPIRVKKQNYVEFELPGGRGLALCPRREIERRAGSTLNEPKEGKLNGVELHFTCDNLPRVLARLVAAGARELSALKERNEKEEAAYFADPEGNILIIGRRLTAETA
ncbi:MAG: hypothetical protein GY847_15595 [Proteobacteria bacterium]|nr:hypothetical protein [Pseudomonadota bacterium]